MKNESVCFKERQKFQQIGIWVFFILLASVFWYGFIQQVIFGIPFGNKPASDLSLSFFLVVFGIGFPLLFYFLNLTTEVRNDGIYIRFAPFHIRFQKILFTDIDKYKIIKYRPFLDYGGWGIRYGIKGKAYNVSGNIGMEFQLKNGKKILIGTQEPDNFKHAVDKGMGGFNSYIS
ncbi:MAG TPA: DUF6141 family protein [Bacillota bacterium]|nr:DUF6141 family protein [Bacillota bacterium]